MFLELLWTALQFVQSEDTIRFHAKLFRCFLLGLVDPHSEPDVLSRGPEWVLAALVQRLVDATGLAQDPGHLNDTVPNRASLPGRCPPKKRHDNKVTLSPSFAPAASPTDQMMPLPFLIISQPINITHGLYHHQPTRAAVAFDLSGSSWCWTCLAPAYSRFLLGSGPVLVGHGGPLAGVVGCVLVWLLTLAIVVPRSSSMAKVRSGSTLVMCRSSRVAVESTANSGERVARPFSQEHCLLNEAIQRSPADRLGDVARQMFVPGIWLHQRQEQGTLEGSVFDSARWTLLCACARMGMKTRACFAGWTLIFDALDRSNRVSKDMVFSERETEDCYASVDQIDACVRDVAQDLHGSTTTDNRFLELSAIGEVATQDLDPMLDVTCGEKNGLTSALVASSNAGRVLSEEEMTSDVDESGSKDEPKNVEDDGSSGIAAQRVDLSTMEKDENCVHGSPREAALPDVPWLLPLRRSQSSGHLCKKHDIFDEDEDDEGTSGDSYWTEQVNARLSSESNFPQAPYQYGLSDGLSWPREGREDETENWRTRSSQATRIAAPEEASEAVQCQANDDSTKVRRYSSPPLDMNTSPSRTGRYVPASLSFLLKRKLMADFDPATSGDGSQGIYVVPQKRGRTTGGRCWSPGSGPRPSHCHSGLGFFPFGKAPALLTPEAWRPGCLYIPDPPTNESSQADVWLDSVTSVGGCVGVSATEGRTCGAGAAVQDASSQGPPFSRDLQDGHVSWRDRHENDPASRRFVSVHRRAVTEG